MVVTSRGERMEIAYERIERIVEHERWMYIYIGSISALIVPLAVFADRAEQQAFFEVLERMRSHERAGAS